MGFIKNLTISSFIYVGLGRSKMFQVHPIPRLILSVIIGLYSANSFDFSRIIGIAAFAVTTGITIMLVWHVLLARGKPQSIQLARWDLNPRLRATNHPYQPDCG